MEAPREPNISNGRQTETTSSCPCGYSGLHGAHPTDPSFNFRGAVRNVGALGPTRAMHMPIRFTISCVALTQSRLWHASEAHNVSWSRARRLCVHIVCLLCACVSALRYGAPECGPKGAGPGGAPDRSGGQIIRPSGPTVCVPDRSRGSPGPAPLLVLEIFRDRLVNHWA